MLDFTFVKFNCTFAMFDSALGKFDCIFAKFDCTFAKFDFAHAKFDCAYANFNCTYARFEGRRKPRLTARGGRFPRHYRCGCRGNGRGDGRGRLARIRSAAGRRGSRPKKMAEGSRLWRIFRGLRRVFA